MRFLFCISHLHQYICRCVVVSGGARGRAERGIAGRIKGGKVGGNEGSEGREGCQYVGTERFLFIYFYRQYRKSFCCLATFLFVKFPQEMAERLPVLDRHQEGLAPF